ncbi:WxL domain-containing protein [Companilactobacillus heilongjiangensis]|uniref:WxL domain-containing protein n=1 Tax=Companilactobacillus heilongjiangensis TaxID=1074467 RepID=A0A0K2LE02_9LACO|nr:WxL domain-containing protein [Companilactobacillus heilongjiangensis]ALB29529.1 hypothetical protein JP39_09300 [Companilactobacillus heilongjiangensis]
MKLSRNVLVGSLAVSGMVLGAVAPAMTAQAATSTADINASTGAVTPKAEYNIGNLNNPDNGQLAIAMDSKDGANDGTASATSNAAVKVVTGVLVLDQVPDFNFGTAVSGQKKDLVDNTRPEDAKSVDGNADGSLSVLESRQISNGSEGATGATGFSLTAKLGQFVDASAQPIAGDSAFTLNLLAQPISDGQNTISNAAGEKLSTQAAELTSATAAKDSTAKSVMNVSTADGSSYKDGQYLATFNAADKATSGKAGANLLIPSGLDNSSAAVKSLNAPITWTLKTTPTVA